MLIAGAVIPNTNVNHPTIDPASNRFTTGQGYVYDFNGNLVQDAEGRSFTFNGDDKQTEVRDTATGQVIGQYFYDASGARVKKFLPSTGETTIFVYDAGGALAAEYSTAAPPQNPTTSYLTTDHLGSPRVITDQNGQVISRRDFMPFGEELGAGTGPRTESLKYSYIGSDHVRQRFTGYEKDDETGLDFAEARMYQNKHGRFTAPDPLLASASAANPQTFNRYVYTGNNPVNYTDPSGLSWCQKNGSDIVRFTGQGVACEDGWTNIDKKKGVARTDFSDRSTNGAAAPGSIIELNSNGTVTVLDPSVPGQAEQIANATGASVANTQEEVVSSSAAVNIASSFTPRPLIGFAPCPEGSHGCSSTAESPSIDLTHGASIDEVLDAGQTALELIGMIPGFELADAASGLISEARGDHEGAVLSLGAMLPVGGQAFTASKWARRLERATELGLEGERLAGLTRASKKAIDVDGRKLFPDAVDTTARALTEVKNVGKLSYTRQLRDYHKYASSQPQKLDFILWTRPDTKLSGPLRRAIDSGDIIHKCFGGRCR